MEINIVINKDIYLNYKDEILALNARIFSDPCFYNIKNADNIEELDTIKNFLIYADNIIIHTTSTFIDYVNILLILEYLSKNNYENNVIIKYYLVANVDYKKAVFATKTLKKENYEIATNILNCIRNDKEIKDTIDIAGSISFNNFYNMLLDFESFMLCLDDEIDDSDGDIDLIASYLDNKYQNMGLSLDFYKNYLKEHMK